ncbi:MAG: hypothetical protein HY602_00135 [Parcubacteria group bacterium]|nr:hypothetical protein [Parcubacteria group bacterium]
MTGKILSATWKWYTPVKLWLARYRFLLLAWLTAFFFLCAIFLYLLWAEAYTRLDTFESMIPKHAILYARITVPDIIRSKESFKEVALVWVLHHNKPKLAVYWRPYQISDLFIPKWVYRPVMGEIDLGRISELFPSLGGVFRDGPVKARFVGKIESDTLILDFWDSNPSAERVVYENHAMPMIAFEGWKNDFLSYMKQAPARFVKEAFLDSFTDSQIQELLGWNILIGKVSKGGVNGWFIRVEDSEGKLDIETVEDVLRRYFSFLNPGKKVVALEDNTYYQVVRADASAFMFKPLAEDADARQMMSKKGQMPPLYYKKFGDNQILISNELELLNLYNAGYRMNRVDIEKELPCPLDPLWVQDGLVGGVFRGNIRLCTKWGLN